MPTTKGLFAVAYLAGFGSIIAFSANVWLLHHVRPTLAGSYAYVNPVVAVVLGAWLSVERFSAHDLGAMAVILLGVGAITLSSARAPQLAPAAGVEPLRGRRSIDVAMVWAMAGCWSVEKAGRTTWGGRGGQ